MGTTWDVNMILNNVNSEKRNYLVQLSTPAAPLCNIIYPEQCINKDQSCLVIGIGKPSLGVVT